MPMRPAMSVMETTEAPPVDPHHAGLDVSLRPTAPIRPGMPATLTLTIRDAATGKPIEDLVRTHQVWAHLILTRSDLSTFAHVHPQPTGDPGRLRVRVTFPTAGRYTAHTEFRRERQMADVLAASSLDVAGPGFDRQAPVPSHEARTTTRHGVTVRLAGLRPYLGAAGRGAIVKADGTGFAHRRPRAGGARPVRRPRDLPLVGGVPARRRHRGHRSLRRSRGLGLAGYLAMTRPFHSPPRPAWWRRALSTVIAR